MQQALQSILAVFAFLPVSLCTGYTLAWFADFHGFRQRTLVERLFWSVPLSIAVSTISAVLIGKFLSLAAVVDFFALGVLGFIAAVCFEAMLRRKSRDAIRIGFEPLGWPTALCAALWIAFTIASLVDIQRGQRLFMSLTFFDHGARVNWAESILRTGIPPANPEYFEGQPAPLRYYYFWLVDCAVAARMSGLSMRAVTNASCIWSAFCLAAVLGLYLKHFLRVRERLRSQFLIAIALLTVTGPYVVIDAWDLLVLRRSPPGLEVWPEGQITSWLDNFFFYPHHTVALACCMFGFLLAWLEAKQSARRLALTLIIIGMSFASAFGLSVYVAFAFFLVMLFWATWQLAAERAPRPVINLALGGCAAALLLVPYLFQLTHSTSKMHGSSPFGFAIRETISPDLILRLGFLRAAVAAHPVLAINLAKLLLMFPGYTIELGFYFIVLSVYVVALCRRRSSLDAPQRALLIIALATFPCISFIRSEVLNINDFGIHGGMFIEFPLLLLASELVMIWKQKLHSPGAHTPAPEWMTSGAKLLAGLGFLSTIYIASMLRFGIFVVPDKPEHSLSHKAFISAVGYAHLHAVTPRNAVVQFNPHSLETFWKNTDLIHVDRQIAMAYDQPPCGADLGGDPSACPAMLADIPPLFRGGTAQQARTACVAHGIQYLVTNVYDPVWKDPNSWVWTLKPVVADPEFRTLDCTHQAERP